MYGSNKFRCVSQIANCWSQHILKSHPVLSLSHRGTVFVMTCTWIPSSDSGNWHSINSPFSPKVSNVFIKGGMATFTDTWHFLRNWNQLVKFHGKRMSWLYLYCTEAIHDFRKKNKTLKQARRSKTVQLVQLLCSEGTWCQNSTFLSLTFILILVTGT